MVKHYFQYLIKGMNYQYVCNLLISTYIYHEQYWEAQANGKVKGRQGITDYKLTLKLVSTHQLEVSISGKLVARLMEVRGGV